MSAPTFPPLLTGQATVDDPVTVAITMARDGCDSGTVVYNLSASTLRAAMIFAPEVALRDAIAALPVCGIGFQNALGAIAPPEISVHLKWDGTILLNGAHCGGLVVHASTTDPDQIPDWLIVGMAVPFWDDTTAPGDTPDQTTLFEEGCSDVTPVDLLEGWARHSLVWISRWLDEGTKPVHGEFSGLWHKDAGDLGLDPALGLLRKTDDTTTLTPLTDLLEHP